MFYKYNQLENYLDGKLVWEQTYSISFLRLGDDFVGTYNGKECIRIFRDDSFLITMPEWHGQHWLSHYGYRMGITSTSTLPWRNGLEAHKKLYFTERPGFDRRCVRILGTKRHIQGRIDNYRGVGLSVPQEDIPREKILTPASKKLLNEQVKEWTERTRDAKAIQTLRGERKDNVPYYHRVLRREHEFIAALKNGSLKEKLLSPLCSPNFVKNLSRWKYSDEVVQILGLETEIVG